MKLVPIYIVCILLALGAIGCAKPPTEVMNNAVEAVTRAENDADAVMYAGNTLARARDALNRMRAEADSKRYDAAKTLAAEAIASAERAVVDGRAGAARARDEAASLLSSLRSEIEQTGQGIQSARNAGLNLDYNELNRDYDTARQSADQAEVANAGNRYNDALERGRNARAVLSGINQKLTNAVTAISSK